MPTRISVQHSSSLDLRSAKTCYQGSASMGDVSIQRWTWALAAWSSGRRQRGAGDWGLLLHLTALSRRCVGSLGSVSPALGWRSVLSAHLQQSLLWTSLISQLVFSQSHQVSFKTLKHRLQTFFTRRPQQGSGVEKWPIFWVSRNSDEKWLLISDGGCAWHGLGTVVVFQNYGWPFCKMKKILFNPMLTR